MDTVTAYLYLQELKRRLRTDKDRILWERITEELRKQGGEQWEQEQLTITRLSSPQ